MFFNLHPMPFTSQAAHWSGPLQLQNQSFSLNFSHSANTQETQTLNPRNSRYKPSTTEPTAQCHTEPLSVSSGEGSKRGGVGLQRRRGWVSLSVSFGEGMKRGGDGLRRRRNEVTLSVSYARKQNQAKMREKRTLP